jgi:hypothetical protein
MDRGFGDPLTFIAPKLEVLTCKTGGRIWMGFDVVGRMMMQDEVQSEDER